MMKLPYLASVAVLALPSCVMAIEPGPSSPQQAATENWLALQVSGRAASTTPPTASATERDVAAQRWVDSFKHEIPAFFEQKIGGKTEGSN